MKSPTQTMATTPAPHRAKPSISSDRPVKSLEADRYELKLDFIPRLARLALDWPTQDGLVIGLFGSWGIGKTSVLNMFRDYVEQNRSQYTNVIVASFNPWFYEDTGALIASFFATISTELDKDTEKPWSRAAKTFKAMGAFLTVASKGVSLFGLNFDAGKIKDGLKAGEAVLTGVEELSGGLAALMDKGQKNLDDHRETVEQALSSLGTKDGRLVILIDDVDRLNKTELLTLLRLVRIVADLPFITLVIAMDDERVRDVLERAVSEGYGQGFLDKIIQVPLHVPLPGREVMIAELVGQLKVAFETRGLPFPNDLTPNEFRQPRELDALVSLVRTPRDLARYINGLRTLLLAGKDPDVHPTDASLVEAVRIFHPDVYDRVRRYKAFLTGESDFSFYAGPGRAQDLDRERSRRTTELDQLVRGGASALAPKTEESIRNLLSLLFGDLTHPAAVRMRKEEAAMRKIRSPESFDNYFRYAPPAGAIRRQDIVKLFQDMLSYARTKSEDGVARALAVAFKGRDEAVMGRMAEDLGHELQHITHELLEPIGKGILATVDQLPQDIIVGLLRDMLAAAVNFRLLGANENLREATKDIPFNLLRMALGSRLSLDRLHRLAKDARNWVDDEQFRAIVGEVLRITERELQAGNLFKEQINSQMFDTVVPAFRLSKMLGEASPVSWGALQSHLVEFINGHPEVLPQILSFVCSDPLQMTEEETRKDLQSLFGDHKRLQPVYEKLQGGNFDAGPYRQFLEAFGKLLASPNSAAAPSSDSAQTQS